LDEGRHAVAALVRVECCAYAGGTSVYLAKELGARVLGITISHKQVEMATAKVDVAGLAGSVTVFHGDGERLDTLPELQPHVGSFDAVWISEALSHFADRGAFFRHAAAYLKPGGKLVLADWFRAEHISERLEAEIIKPIESGMLREYSGRQGGGWCEERGCAVLVLSRYRVLPQSCH
jgi:tocopherol O-methyltransferase